MSFDAIAHLDWQPPAAQPAPLRERAAQAYAHEGGAHKTYLIQAAARKIVEVLGVMCGELLEVNITNLKDGDGEVIAIIDGMKLRVGVLHLKANTDDEVVQVTLGVRTKGGGMAAIASLAELGRLIAEDRVEMFEGEARAGG